MDQSLAAVMRNINDALRLDKDSHDKEAYVKYLDCIFCITCSLQQAVRDRGGDVVVTKQVTKQVKLAQQCIERVSILVDKIGSNQRPAVLKSPMEETRVVPKTKPFAAVPPLPPDPTVNTFARTRDMTPMELAYIKNQQLMAAYRARMARMNKHDPGAFNLSLTIQRKMAENMAIAKKSEMALAKKMQERQERLEEQAAKRFATPIGMSEEEQEQRQIYKKILEYEQDAKWLQDWRQKLESNPQEPEVICQLIQEILRCRDHPLTLLIKQYQHKVYEKIYPIIGDKKQRLSAITVPLDKSLWPPELLEDKVAEGCKLEIFSKPKGNGEGETVVEDGGTDSQKSEDASSSSSSTEAGVVSSKEEAQLDSEASDTSNSAGAEKTKEKKDYNSDRLDDNCAEKEDSGNDQEQELSDKKQYDSGVSFNSSSENDSKNPPTSTGEDAIRSEEFEGETSFSENIDEEQAGSVSEKSNQDVDSTLDTYTDDISEHCKASSETDTDKNNANQLQSDSEDALKASAGSSAKEHESSDEGSDAQSMVKLTEDTKRDLSVAMKKGEVLQAHLKAERAKAVRVLRQISQDYETYNAENMDDLFDDEDDEVDEEPQSAEGETKSNNQEEQPQESFKPRSPSGSSLKEADSRISRSSSNNSVQDFPSLPSVEENQADIQRMSREAYQRHVKNISADVHMYLDKLLVLFTIAYEQLDSPLGRDQCYASLEETFFKPLWKFLLMLFRLANYQDELIIACKMTQKMDAGPREVGVRKKLCLMPSSEAGLSSGKTDIHPYQQAIEQLRRIKDYYTMLSKLECVVKVVRQVCDSVKEFYISQGCKPADVPSVGADDLVPVISYVVLQSRLPQLVSECQAMAEFIHEGYIMGQEGYCLTTLETAVSYIVSSDLSEPFSPS